MLGLSGKRIADEVAPCTRSSKRLKVMIKSNPEFFFEDHEGKNESIVVLGGMLEVQPKSTIILGDSAIRTDDLDEAAALKAKIDSEKLISQKKDNIDYAKIKSELAIAVAQLRIIRKFKK